ncbi:hypothetical protein [Enterococcus sp. UD-01]|jgi:pyridoxal/pyridoxine/pyridoxamine kinase|uniref:hypothetical protein n=1 Tax=Enterococcus sp. UD-01 TaxID=3373911 RepID=UPI00383738C4
MLDLMKFILVILAIWLVYQLFTTILFTLSQKAVAKRIKSGKMSDQQLANLYQAVARANQGSTFQAIFSYGIFYRSHAKQSDAVYELYRAEMEKRNLL